MDTFSLWEAREKLNTMIMKNETGRRNYERPEMTVVRINNSDIIAVSGEFKAVGSDFSGDTDWTQNL